MDRYLPIGTVCSINNTNRKYIIIGYFSLEYSYNIKLYDYIGLPYPEGFLMKNKINSFNHDDITSIEHLGLVNEDFEKFNNILCDSSIESEEDKELDSLFSNFTFDENGVVVYEYKTLEPVESSIIVEDYDKKQIEKIIENPFTEKEKYYTNPEKEEFKDWDVFKKIEFDENGVVVDFSNDEDSNLEQKLDEEYNQTSYSDGDMTLIKNDNYEKLLFDNEGNVLIADEN